MSISNMRRTGKTLSQTTRPNPTNREIKLSSQKMLVSKTDASGYISYANENFVEISGYSESELIGSPHNILRHPDMPKAIFYIMWQNIKSNKNIMAVVKNLAKNGNHYWVTTDFEIRKNREGKITNYLAFRQSASKSIIKAIEPLYSKMIEIEESQSMDESLKYLDSFLDEKDMSYNEFIKDLALSKGLAYTFFQKMKDLFG